MKKNVARLSFSIVLISCVWMFAALGAGESPRRTNNVLPAIQEYLDRLQKVGNELDNLTPESAYWVWQKRESLSTRIIEPIVVQRDDLLVPARGHQIPIRIYTPKDTAEQNQGLLPGLIFVHGGGWTIGSIATYDSVCAYLSRQIPAMVASIDYRLAPEHPFPAAIQDVYTTVQWIGAHKNAIFDTNRLAVGGDSGGANLAIATALLTRERNGVPICFQVLYYPSTDIENTHYPSYQEYGTGYLLTTRAVESFRSLYLPNLKDWTNPLASPLLASNLANMPRTLIIAAGFDPLRDEGKKYQQRLQDANVTVDYKVEPDFIHGFLNFFNSAFFTNISPVVKARMDEHLSLIRKGIQSPSATN